MEILLQNQYEQTKETRRDFVVNYHQKPFSKSSQTFNKQIKNRLNSFNPVFKIMEHEHFINEFSFQILTLFFSFSDPI